MKSYDKVTCRRKVIIRLKRPNFSSLLLNPSTAAAAALSACPLGVAEDRHGRRSVSIAPPCHCCGCARRARGPCVRLAGLFFLRAFAVSLVAVNCVDRPVRSASEMKHFRCGQSVLCYCNSGVLHKRSDKFNMSSRPRMPFDLLSTRSQVEVRSSAPF